MANEIRERNEITGITLLWNGDHTIHVLDADGHEIVTRSTYAFTGGDEDPENIRASMRRVLAEMCNRKPEPDDAYDGPHGQIYDDDDNPTDLAEMDAGLGIFGEIYGDEYGGEYGGE